MTKLIKKANGLIRVLTLGTLLMIGGNKLDAQGSTIVFGTDDKGVKTGELYINPTNNLMVGVDTELSSEGDWNYFAQLRLGRNDNMVTDYIVPKRMSLHGDFGKRSARGEIMVKNPARIATEKLGTDNIIGRTVDAIVPSEVGDNIAMSQGNAPMHRLQVRNNLRAVKFSDNTRAKRILNDFIPNTVDNRIGEDRTGKISVLRSVATFGTNGIRQEVLRPVPFVGDALADNAPNRVQVLRTWNGHQSAWMVNLQKDF